jgi:hypothetical protein
MIRKEELRIGNLIYSGGVKFKVVGFFGGIVMCLADNMGYNFSEFEIKPIEITPKILRKCGFVKKVAIYENGKLLAFIGSEGVRIALNLEQFENPELRTIHYLHELQNLFFCLTGEELKIEL